MLNGVLVLSNGRTQRCGECRDDVPLPSEHKRRLVRSPHRGVVIRGACRRLGRPGAPTRGREYDTGRAWVRDRAAGHLGVRPGMSRTFRGTGAACLIDEHGAN